MLNALIGIITIFAAAVGLATKWLGLDQDSVLWVAIPLAIAAVGALAWLVLNAAAIARFATSRSARYGVNMFGLSVIVIFIAVMLNVIVTGKGIQWDTTKNKRFSLAPQSERVVANLDQDIVVTAVRPDTPTRETAIFTEVFNSQMALYRAVSGRVSYRIVDARREPELVADLPKPLSPGDIFVSAGDRHEKVEPYRFSNLEEKITRAIIAATRAEKKTVFFVTRRPDKIFELPTGFNQGGEFSQLRAALESQNLEVRTLDLLAEGRVPDDCSVLFLADPTYQFGDADLRALTDYVNRGGQLLIALDIEPVLNRQADSALVGWLQQFGCVVGRDVVIEPQTVLSLASGLQSQMTFDFAVANFSESNDITKDLFQPVVMSVARSVTTENLPPGVDAEPLLRTSGDAWAEDGIDLLISQGVVNPGDSKLRGDVPLIQLLTLDLTQRRAEFTPETPARPEGVPTTLTLATPEGEAAASPEPTVSEPTAPLEISPVEAEMGPSLDDEPAPGGAVDEGGRDVAPPAPAEEASPETAVETATAEAVTEEAAEGAGESESSDQAEEEEPEATQARILVLGDITLLTEQWMVPGRTGNRDFVLNAVNYLAQETDLVAIPPRDNINTGFSLTSFSSRFLVILLIAIPLIVAVTGGVVAVRRRRLA